MAKRKPVQAADSPSSLDEKPLTWEEEKFIDSYIRNGGNSTRAYIDAFPGTKVKTAGTLGPRLVGKVGIIEAIDEERARLSQKLNFDRQEYFRSMIGMLGATLDDFTKLFDDPTKRSNYVGLKEKKLALESAKQTVYEDAKGNLSTTNEIKIISPGERRAIANELWDKLGLDKAASKGNWFDGFEHLAELVRGSKKTE